MRTDEDQTEKFMQIQTIQQHECYTYSPTGKEIERLRE